MRGSVRRCGMSLAWLGLAVVAACYGARSGGVDPSPAADTGDGPSSPRDSAPGATAGAPAFTGTPDTPASPGPPGSGGTPWEPEPAPGPAPVADYEVPLDPEQAACLGLDQPVCAACHGFHGDGIIVLRPEGAPPHPPGTQVGDEPRLRECGFAD